MTDSDPDPTASENAVHVKLPEFGSRDPRLWFVQVKAIFDSGGIRSQKSMYNFMVANLPEQVATEVADLIYTRPSVSPYDTKGRNHRTNCSNRREEPARTSGKSRLDSAGILIRQLRDGINVSVIPAELRAANVRECNQPAHTGCHRTYEVLKQRAYWPGRKNDVDNHVRACQQCQLVKSNNHPSQYPTQPIPSYTRMVHQSMFLGVLSMHHPTLPRDPRTLMRTPRDCPEKYIGSGVYVHFGLEKASLRHFSLPGNDDYISTQLQLHIDRVSPFNASKTQF
ncbi:uncharacterized protein DEA37_0005461 [Paragonimus westermani]|uniref:Uncharacterized protein n=1 Tax=Paragonimus westermani TaxID=34504 RepID=A0A5J4NAA7_9TREM|nr:uncharacterized protein DEA37_0005461 [Paragonimus westermani]